MKVGYGMGIGAMLVAVLTLSGCGGSKAVVGYAGKANGQPVFCLAKKADCAQPGASVPALEVDAVDPDGQLARVMWRIEAPNGGDLDAYDKIAYGTAPIGWTVTAPAQALRSGEHYRVNSQFYFSITANGLILTENHDVPARS